MFDLKQLGFRKFPLADCNPQSCLLPRNAVVHH